MTVIKLWALITWLPAPICALCHPLGASCAPAPPGVIEARSRRRRTKIGGRAVRVAAAHSKYLRVRTP